MIRLLALLAALLLWGGAATAQTFPKFTGLVVDAANVLPEETKADLTAKLEKLQQETGRQVVVATIPDLQGYPIADYGYRLGRAWQVGLKDVNNGAILFIAPNEPKGHRGPRIEVGYGLEPVLTDAFSSQVIQQEMLPRLKAGDVPGAMTAGTDAIIAQLRASPDEAKARTDAAIRDFDSTHKRARTRTEGNDIPIGVIFWILVVGFILLSTRRRRYGRVYRQHDSGLGNVATWVALEALSAAARSSGNRSSGWGGGGSSGWGGGGSDGSWGGGGFTGGGGGSFGGGGASGDW